MKRLLALVVACVLLAAVPSQAAIVHVQETAQFQGLGVNTVTSAAFGSQPVVGNHIIVAAGIWNDPIATSVTCSDNQGNTYATDIFKAETPIGTSGGVTAICSAKIATSSGAFTVTVTTNVGAGNYINATAVEFSGLTSSVWLDKTGNNLWAGAVNAATVTASGANAQANELVIASVELDASSSNVHVATATSGYTAFGVQQDTNSSIGWQASYKIISAGETSSAAWNHDSSPGSAVIATYKAAAGAAATCTRLLLLGAGC